MTYNKRLNIRVTNDDYVQILKYKDLKNTNNEVFNLSDIVRKEIRKQITTFDSLEER